MVPRGVAPDERLRAAVQHFWSVRRRQSKSQGRSTGVRDQGGRTAVTGGKQLDGFAELLRDLLVEAGLDETSICLRKKYRYLPGFFRPHKEWDVLAIVDGDLIAVLEFKALVGSFGKNLNNRSEEAIGNATDFWAAYRDGVFSGSARPWVGYLMLLEEAAESTSPVAVNEPHFPVDEEFRSASYAERTEILLTRMVRERLYDATCLILSKREEGLTASRSLTG